MIKFKVGDKAVRISCFTETLPKGHVTKVLKDSLCTDINGVNRDFWPPFWELMPKDIQPTPVTKPTMEEVFESDWHNCSQITGDCAGQMIAKGWVKK
jgi:hypothetical protein